MFRLFVVLINCLVYWYGLPNDKVYHFLRYRKPLVYWLKFRLGHKNESSCFASRQKMKTGVAIFIIHYQLLQAYELPFFAEKQHNYRATLRSSPNYSRAFVCVFLHVGLHMSYQCMKTSLGLIPTPRFGARALVMAVLQVRCKMCLLDDLKAWE